MQKRIRFLLLLIGLAGCEISRDRRENGGYHEAGWANTNDGGKHASWLRQSGYPIEDCQVCHGLDGAESPVLVSCDSHGCHEKGVSFCGTCHGDTNGPRPATGAHENHPAYCNECHDVPKSLRDAQHLNGVIDVIFSGLSTHDNSFPIWNETSNNCSNTYCHEKKEVSWEFSALPSTPCDFCHGNPPESHVRFSAVAFAGSCTTCHPGADQPTHVNGFVETNSMECNTCHGQGPLGAPPAALDGSTDPAQRGVGAHRRHLDETLAERIGKVVACPVCHAVPKTVDAEGHIDTSAPADVTLTLGQYDSVTGRCTSSCHFDVSPGPSWTDTSGAARACDACHGYPPAFTRQGTAHTPSTACFSCHSYTPQTHVNGVVDMTP